MDIKNLSFRKVQWAQKLSNNPFQLYYCQGKAIKAADILS